MRVLLSRFAKGGNALGQNRKHHLFATARIAASNLPFLWWIARPAQTAQQHALRASSAQRKANGYTFLQNQCGCCFVLCHDARKAHRSSVQQCQWIGDI